LEKGKENRAAVDKMPDKRNAFCLLFYGNVLDLGLSVCIFEFNALTITA